MVNGSILEGVSIHDILYTNVYFECAVTHARKLVVFRNEGTWNRRVVPFMCFDVDLLAVWDWAAKLNFGAIDVVATKQIVIAHPLQQKLQVTFIRLKDAIQDGSLVQQISEARHVHRIEHVDLEEHLVSNIVTKEWNSFDQ